jgi:hypothetical protein
LELLTIHDRDCRAETQFRKVVGYTDLAKLALAVERDLLAQRTPIDPATNQDTPIALTV